MRLRVTRPFDPARRGSSALLRPRNMVTASRVWPRRAAKGLGGRAQTGHVGGCPCGLRPVAGITLAASALGIATLVDEGIGIWMRLLRTEL